jgi:acetyl-CoA carboxylase biotin carboxyl carrier protein
MSEQSPLVTRVQLLVEALANSGVGEIELTEDGTRIQIKRASAITPTVLTPPAMPLPPFPAGTITGAAGLPAFGPLPAAAPKAGQGDGRARARPRQAVDTSIAVVSPLTGVYYNASSPASDPFVNVGDTVQAGQVVAIVEAMKVFNEVKSEVSGAVVAIPAKNGQLVHKGDALVRIQPI